MSDNGYAPYGQWVFKVLLLLTGTDKIFSSGTDALRDCEYELLEQWYHEDMTDYDAAKNYEKHIKEINEN